MGDLVIGIHGGDKGARVLVTDNGELVVAALEHSDAYYVNLAVAATPYLVAPMRSGYRFIITGILIASDKDFASPTVAEAVTIYEANPADLATNTKTIFSVALLRSDRLPATGLDLQTSESVALVAIVPLTTAVDVTIAGYYEKSISNVS